MSKIKAGYIFGGVMALKRLMTGCSKFDLDTYWILFDYALEIYKANDKITAMRQEIIKNSDELMTIKKLDKLSDKEFDITIPPPTVKRSQIDTKRVSPDDLAILVSNNLIIIDKDKIEADKKD